MSIEIPPPEPFLPPKKDSLRLAKTPQLRQIAEYVRTAAFDMDATIASLQEGYKRRRLWQPADLSGLLAEAHLEKILKEYNGGVRVVVNPIPPRARTRRFKFIEQSGCLISYSKETGLRQTEYDLVTTVGDIPTIWEIKITQKKPSDRPREARMGHSGVNIVLNPTQIRKSLAPIQEFFRERYHYQGLLGYILIISPGSINPNAEKQQEFIERGGLLVPFYYSYEEWKARVLEAALRHRLSFRSETKGPRGK